MLCWSAFPSAPPFAPPPPRPAARLRSTASSLLWRGLTSRAHSSPAKAHRLPDADRYSPRPPGRTRDLSGSDVLPSCVMGSSTTAERQRLAIAALPMLPSALSTASASAMCNFRGSIAHPTRSLCTLRNRRHRRSRNTRYQAGATPYLGRTSTGWITSASPDALTVYEITVFCCARGGTRPRDKRLGSGGRQRSDDRSGHRNGSRCSSAGSAAPSNPGKPGPKPPADRHTARPV